MNNANTNSNEKPNLTGGFTRNITFSEIDGVPAVIKNYPDRFKPIFIDFSKSTFSLLFLKPRISFLSKEDRILREILGHEKLDEIGIAVPKVLTFSFDDSYIAEEFIDVINLYNVIRDSEKKEMEDIAYQVGKMTGQLHSLGFAFFDNRPQNYIFKDGKIYRTDLETFELEPSDFEKYCDIISFIESFTGKMRDDVHNSFISGYENYAKHVHNRFLENLSRRALLLLNLNRPKIRIRSPFHKDSVSSDGHPRITLKHFLANHFGKPKSN